MYQIEFIGATAVFLAMTLFIYFNYPKSWRRDKMFNLVLLLWHITGMVSLCCIFTVFKFIPHIGLRYEIVRIGTYYYLMVLLMSMLFFVRLVISKAYIFIMKKCHREIPQEKQSWLKDKRVHAMIFIVLAYIITTLGYFNIDILHTTEYDVTIQKSSALSELDALLIADLHAGSGNWEFTYDELERQIDEANADVIFLAGDIFDETTSERDVELVRELLESIQKPKYGIYYIYGNHDSSVDDWSSKQMKSMGVTVLGDQMTILGDDIQLIGHDDPTQSDVSYEELLTGLNVDDTKPVLMLTHRPTQLKQISALGVDLMVAGHTHGFNIPFFMTVGLSNEMLSGIKTFGTMTAITTSGVAAWGWHYKWPAKSEIVKIRIHFTKQQ